MQYTTYYSMKKPENEDLVDIDDINDSMDTIDGQLHEINLAIASINNLAIVTNVSIKNGYVTITFKDGTQTKVSLTNETGTINLIATITNAEWTDVTGSITCTDEDGNIVLNVSSSELAETEGQAQATCDIGTYTVAVAFDNEPTITYSTDGTNYTEATEFTIDLITSGTDLYINIGY